MLTEAQQRTLRAAVDRIIPADDYPSGWEAGVGEYFVRLFARETRFLPVYQSGLDALDAEAKALTETAFADLEAARQDALLRRLEAGDVKTAWPEDPAAFFQRLVEQTMEGFYADPGNGGNKNGVSWDMVGFAVTA